MILVIADGHPQRDQCICISNAYAFFFFLMLASDSFFLAYLDDFAIKMCSPDVNAECLAKSEVF